MVDLSFHIAFIMTAVVAIFSLGSAVLMTLMKLMQYTYKGAILGVKNWRVKGRSIEVSLR